MLKLNEIDKYSYMDSLRDKISKLESCMEGYNATSEYYKGYEKGLKEALKLSHALVDNPAELSCDLKIIDDWVKDPKNQKLLLALILNGERYEDTGVYYVKIKGMEYLDDWHYLNYEAGSKKFALGRKKEDRYDTNFTKKWLKEHWSKYDAYNDAGLLTFERV